MNPLNNFPSPSNGYLAQEKRLLNRISYRFNPLEKLHFRFRYAGKFYEVVITKVDETYPKIIQKL